MKILISNDDGVYAKGLAALVNALKSIADVIVVAPDRNRSGASNSLTLDRPLRARKVDNGFISVEGTPTDCVHVALTGLLDKPPDMVISGINEGSNLGDDVLYSGTVAAATEGRFLGLPAIAVSLVGDRCEHYKTAAQITKQMVEQLKTGVAQLPRNMLLNVNVPDVPIDRIKGFDVTRLGTRHCAEPTIRQTDPRGNEIFWVGPAGAEEDAGPGTDFYAVSDQRVSITPLKIDLTDFNSFEAVSKWLQTLSDPVQ